MNTFLVVKWYRINGRQKSIGIRRQILESDTPKIFFFQLRGVNNGSVVCPSFIIKKGDIIIIIIIIMIAL